MTMGSKHTSFPKLQSHTPLKVCPRKRLLASSVLKEKNSIRGGTNLAITPSNVRRSGDYLELWKFDCLYDYYEGKTHFLLQIRESDLSQSVPLEASTRKERFGKKKLHPRRDSFCNNPLQTSRDRLIIRSFGNFIACRMTLESKHTSFPTLKSQISPKVWPWKRQLARSVLEEKNSIRGGTHFAIIPLKRPEIV